MKHFLYQKILIELFHQKLLIFKEFIKITLDKLTEDKVYQKEYSDFVSSMSYAKDSEVITFEQALHILYKLYIFISQNNDDFI